MRTIPCVFRLPRLEARPTTVVLAALALQACGGGTEPGPGPEQGGAGESSPVELDLELATSLYRGKGGCAVCHGKEGEGNSLLGPALSGLGELWSTESLAEFLANPGAAMVGNSRLQDLASRYSSPMPAASALSAEERRMLAAWVLSL